MSGESGASGAFFNNIPVKICVSDFLMILSNKNNRLMTAVNSAIVAIQKRFRVNIILSPICENYPLAENVENKVKKSAIFATSATISMVIKEGQLTSHHIQHISIINQP